MIYLSPKVAMPAGSTQTLTIAGLINPAFSLSETVEITGFTQVGGTNSRVRDATLKFSLTREIQPCGIFTEVNSVANSYIGGQNDVTFQIDFITGHPVPGQGAISVTFPLEYQIDLISLKATCAPKDFDLTKAAGIPTCRVGAANRVDLYLNGYQLNLITKYSITISGVTTLNLETKSLQFTIASYYYDNIYSNRKICEKKFPFPVLQTIQIKYCQLFTDLTYKNVN